MAKDVIMPVLGMNQDTAVLLAWLKSEGEQVREGEPIMEVETDKATMELDAPATGTLANVTAKAGDEVRVGSTIAIILAEGEAAAARAAPDAEVSAGSSEPPGGALAPGSRPPRSRAEVEPPSPPPRGLVDASNHLGEGGLRAAPEPAGRVPASPKARRLASESGLALSTLRGQGSGPDGAVLAADVLRAAEAGAARRTVDALDGPTPGIAPATVEREVDATELLTLVAWAHRRGSLQVTAGDILVRFTAAIWNRHPLAQGPEESAVLEYLLPISGDVSSGTAPATRVTHPLRSNVAAIAAARSAAEATASSEDRADLAVVDLTASRLDRATGLVLGTLVTVVAGRLQERVVARDGASVLRHTIPLTIVFDTSRVELVQAAVWADQLVSLLQTPSDLLVLY